MERNQARLVDLVCLFDGVDLIEHGEQLRDFIARDVDDPATELNDHVSTCGLFALAVWHTLRVPHELVDAPYKMGMAIQWLTQIAWALQAVRHVPMNGLPTVGALMHYHTPGHNDDHVEFLLSPIDKQGHELIACHGGGGRAHCGVTVHLSEDVRFAWRKRNPEGEVIENGPPLQCWYDLDALMKGQMR